MPASCHYERMRLSSLSILSKPHMSQLPWEFVNDARTELLVDGVAYKKGYGLPGNVDRGEMNNCLIDSLRQCLGDIQCDRNAVRRDLQAEFASDLPQDPRGVVTARSYLDVEHHWEAIVRSLLHHNTSGLAPSFDPRDYCVVALFGDRPGHGAVLGNLTAARRLVVVNWGDVHFDPCLLH